MSNTVIRIPTAEYCLNGQIFVKIVFKDDVNYISIEGCPKIKIETVATKKPGVYEITYNHRGNQDGILEKQTPH
ncbi:MAG: hypothetical protein LR008_02060 [Candidatus Pacebacteria bacterium]|nr:hypothetical protein [Candidatus Paceibacterota bacterium]